MKVNIIYGKDGNECGTMYFSIEDSSLGFSIGCLSEYPEDAMLERDLNFVYEIDEYIKMAYEAGKKGEPLEINIEDEED